MSKEETKREKKFSFATVISRDTELFELPNPGLRAYFAHVRDGNTDEYRTPFYKGKSLETICSEWDKELIAIKSEWPTLYEYEDELRRKVGPMSIQKPLKERLDDIDSYYSSILLEQQPISDSAINAVVREFGSKIGGLRMRSLRKTDERMKHSTNAGAPYFVKRKVVQGKILEEDFLAERAKGPFWAYCNAHHSYILSAVLGWRGQEGGPKPEDVKQRVIWMFPYLLNLLELQVYQPLIERCQEFDLVPAWVGLEDVDRRITQLFDTKGANDLVVCTDFSKFDQHFNGVMQDRAKAILKSLLTKGPEAEDWLNEIFPVKYNIPLCYDVNNGKAFLATGKHGMASGSGGTNADETLVHRALQHEVAIRHGSQLNPNSLCLGDDGVLSYPGITVEDVMQAYTSHGQEMNLDKQYASTQDCTYLRRWHHVNYRQNGICVGVYSTFRALGRLAEQERFYDSDTWSNKMVALRQLSILENVKYHPLKEKFVDFCMKGDKYRLGLDIPGFIDELPSLVDQAIDNMPDFLGYTRTLDGEAKKQPGYGISSWWIVNYLKSKR